MVGQVQAFGLLQHFSVMYRLDDPMRSGPTTPQVLKYFILSHQHQHHSPHVPTDERGTFFFIFAQPRVSIASSGGGRGGWGWGGAIIHAAIATAPVDCACPSSCSGGRSSYPMSKTVRLVLIPFEMNIQYLKSKAHFLPLLLTVVRRDICLQGWSGGGAGRKGNIERKKNSLDRISLWL